MSLKDSFFAWLENQPSPASADQEAPIVTETLDRQPAQPVSPSPAVSAGGSPRASADVSALTERMTSLEAELAAAKALGETQAQSIQRLAAENQALAMAARRKRFTDEVLGKGDASGIRWAGEGDASGIRWAGEIDAHIAMLEHLADSAGEDSPLFAGYVQQQRAHAEQIRTAGLFSETGSGRHGTTGGDAGTQLQRMAQARVADGTAASFAEAMAQLEREQPSLFATYRTAATSRAPKD